MEVLIARELLRHDSPAARAMFENDADYERYVEGRERHAVDLAEGIANKDWEAVLSDLGHVGRGLAFSMLGSHMETAVLHRLLGEWWNITEAVPPSQSLPLFRRAHEVGLVSDSTETLPSGELVVFRGVRTPRHRLGISWTLKPETAEFFATRYGRSGVVYRARIASSDVLAYFNERAEAEVIVDPADLRHIERWTRGA